MGAFERNLALGREIAEIMETINIPIWLTADVFGGMLPDVLLHKLKHGQFKPSIFQLICFMDLTKCGLDNLCVDDYK